VAGRHRLRGGDDDGVVLVLAADLPFLTAQTAAALVAALETDADTGTGEDAEMARAEQQDGRDVSSGGRWEGVMLTDSAGRDQPLAAAYRAEPLRRELALLKAEHGRLTGLPLRFLTGELRLRRIADPTGEASFDCDTWEDVAAARARFAPHAEGPDESER
jgi:CTP:molybdopterin cytidylyltransferase MocA